MQDSIQQGLQALAMRDVLTRDIAIVCAAAIVYALGAVWLLVLARRRARLTLTTVARLALLGLGAYLVSKALTGLVVDPRPYLVAHTRPPIPVARDNGFPSDHTLLAALFTAGLWWIDRRWLPAFAAGTLLVALGRLGIGAHHTLDVVGSALIVAVVAVAIDALPLPRTWNRPILAPLRSSRTPVRSE